MPILGFENHGVTCLICVCLTWFILVCAMTHVRVWHEDNLLILGVENEGVAE